MAAEQLALTVDAGQRTTHTEYRVVTSALTYEPLNCGHDRCVRAVAPPAPTGDGQIIPAASLDQAEAIRTGLYAPARIEHRTVVTYTTAWSAQP